MGIGLHALRDLVERLSSDRAAWHHLVRFEPDKRCYVRLRGDESVDVWLLMWSGGQTTSLHDHGASEAAFTVISGCLEEIRSDSAGRVGSATISAGATLTVPRGDIHDVRHRSSGGDEVAVSIHAYSPPLRQMTFYEWQGSALVATRIVDRSDHEFEESL